MADQGTEGLLSPYLRRKRFNAAIPYLKGKVLDVGCGTGELAKYFEPENYVGVELDKVSIATARTNFPKHKFFSSIQEVSDLYDTVVSLAVIEHVKDPVDFLMNLKNKLNNDKNSSIILTTPHPSMDWIHDIGASIGLFSQHANDEHEDLLNKDKLKSIGSANQLELKKYKKFLMWANQMVQYKRIANEH